MSEEKDHIKIGKFSALIPSRTHTFANNTPFYAAVPYPFQQYYMRQVRQYFQWYDGYVDWFHNHMSGVFSTRLAYTVLHKLARQTVGKRILFDGDSKQNVAFIERFSKKKNLTQKVKRAVEWAFAGGDALIKLDSYKNDLTVSAIRKDNYWIESGWDGELKAANILVYTYTNQIQKNGQEYEELFYLFEERKYNEQGEPVWRLNVKRGTGHGVSFKNVDIQEGECVFRELPKNIRGKLKKDYPNSMFGEWDTLPYRDLGCYLIKATEGVSFMPSLPFGESLLSNAMDILMSYDYYYSLFNTDLYLGRGRVLMPSHMQNPHEQYDYDEHFTGLDSFMIQMIPYVNPENQKPTPLQFDLRSENWESIRNHLLQSLATKIGISERSIATYVVPAAEKPTATEISSDEDATSAFVEDKREMLQNTLDVMLRSILDYYDKNIESVYTKFTQVGLGNINNLINRAVSLEQNGLADKRTLIEMVFPDKTDKQIEEMLLKIKEEEQQRNQIPTDQDTIEKRNNDNFKMQNTLNQTKE